MKLHPPAIPHSLLPQATEQISTMSASNPKASSLEEIEKNGNYLEEPDPDAGLSDAERAAIVCSAPSI